MGNSMDIDAEHRFKEHQSGWILYCGDNKLGELEFLHIDGFVYMFELKPDIALNNIKPVFGLRSINPEIRLINRRDKNLIIRHDEMGLYTADFRTVSVRDFRVPAVRQSCGLIRRLLGLLGF
jgi:hypothetical protein